ncbi:glutaredoxin 2 isoform X1 [Xyrauchen texanus]|uniref:glutaredoxin 2 isoform X1 n=2 Tax=Xyrauchen texanus TaxID=154827 RepID=UPI002242A790|nr:glutaredoxin 2 isoform X1 [Xyrauchen texanus]
MTDFNNKTNSLLSALTVLAFLVSLTCLIYRPVIITRLMGNFSSSAPGLSSSACTQFVQDIVSKNCVVIFSKTTCPYCKMTKNVFNEMGASYKVIELDEHNDGRRLQETLAQMTGARTVPRVFINGQCIGGGSDTKQLHQQGKLLPLIVQCRPCCLSNNPEGSENAKFQTNP